MRGNEVACKPKKKRKKRRTMCPHCQVRLQTDEPKAQFGHCPKCNSSFML
ncbi:MAG: hypothetical protein GWN58_32995 [Anaerolineae bacterium]|nr:hypothetical protein [Thermoplasmata archaeon]NIV34093.1 hypothetical protein [Anaerolineae bacterium]NIY05944.1 hypothetical protein [Thermoplasmata archaeon]